MHELMSAGLMSQSCSQKLAQRGRLEVVRRGGGARGQVALIAVDSLPKRYRDAFMLKYPMGGLECVKAWVMSHYEVDQHAMVFFHSREQAGLQLSAEKIQEYVTNASVLNCCIKLYHRASTAQKLFGGKYNWEMMSTTIEALRLVLGHTLPGSTLKFRKKVRDYERDGYKVLISEKFGNQNARKVDWKTERLILALAVLPNKPFNTDISEMYNMFVCGELDVYDPKTGALLDPAEWTDKVTGEPKTLSASTIMNYLNKPKNKLLIEERLSSWSTFMHEQMPHVHRHGGDYSLSQITMDDVDLTRKLKDTKQRVHAYYAYDVVSGCVVGAAYARQKTEVLVVECFRDMFRFVDRMGWGMPAGIEVENHLMSQYKDGFLQAGVAFPFVRFCAPLNSQEKYAESLNGAKKKRVIHRNHTGIGRFYGKGKWRTESTKISDASNDTYEDAAYFSWDELVADDRRDCDEWNHTLHPNQKLFPGMTRWQVLTERVNPYLEPLDKMTLARYIGERVETSVKRNSTVRVDYTDWWLSDTSVLERLSPNDYKVTAYYLPDEEGRAHEVYLFQGDRYIDKVEKVVTFNRVMAEQTEADAAAFVAQQKKISKFRKYVADERIEEVGVLKRTEDWPAVAAPPEDVDFSPASGLAYGEAEEPLAYQERDALADI